MKYIKFIEQSDRKDINLPAPSPSIDHVPDWWIKGESWINSDNPIINNYDVNFGMKRCLAFMDSFHLGYVLTTWTDIQVSINPNDKHDVKMTWLSSPDPISVRNPNQGRTIPRPAGHCDTHFAWLGQWGIEVPKGYSVIVTHPFNRFDLPFTTLSGVIDSDNCWAAGNLPFFIKLGWEGIIPAGTPFAQIIPFKREKWKYSIGDEKDEQKVLQQSFDSRRTLKSLYKNKSWQKKEFN